MSETVASATKVLAERYLDIMNSGSNQVDRTFLSYESKTSIKNLRWMCEVIVKNADTYPIDKLSRWLGFVQGVLASRGLIDVDTERDFSRPLFHAAYAADSLPIPPTRSMTD